MIRSTGLTYLNRQAVDRHNSNSIHGKSYVGTLVDALSNGFVESFQGKVFYDDAAIGTPVQVTDRKSTR